MNVEQHEVLSDETSDRRYFAMIGNFIDDLELSPLAIALYFHYKRWAYLEDRRSPGVKFLMKKFKVSDRSIKKAKEELVREGLIRVETFDPKECRADQVTLLDIWERNIRHCKKQDVEPERPVVVERHPVVNERQVSYKPVVEERQPRRPTTTAPSSNNDTKKEYIKNTKTHTEPVRVRDPSDRESGRFAAFQSDLEAWYFSEFQSTPPPDASTADNIRWLFANGFTLDEVRGFYAFAKTDPKQRWRDGPVNLGAIAKGIGAWRKDQKQKPPEPFDGKRKIEVCSDCEGLDGFIRVGNRVKQCKHEGKKKKVL